MEEARALTRLPSVSNPLGNLVFTRDQQITTSKGVVMANMPPKQRYAPPSPNFKLPFRSK